LGDVMRGLKTIRDVALSGTALDEVQARRNAERMVVKNIVEVGNN